MHHIRSAASRGLAVLCLLSAAAIAPAAHAQSGTLAYSGATSCTSFTGWTWNDSQLTVNCPTTTTPTTPTPPATPTCDSTKPGAFSFATSTAAVGRGVTAALEATSTGGRSGACEVWTGPSQG